MKVVDGDLLRLASQGLFDVIVHGCNCFCEMDAGIAKTIKEKFPEALQSDLATKRGAIEKLGSFSAAEITRNNIHFTIINAYTQFHSSGQGVLVDYNAIRMVFRRIKQQYTGKRIAYPKIGAGLARGDWNLISEIINEQLQGEDHTLVNYVPVQSDMNSP